MKTIEINIYSFNELSEGAEINEWEYEENGTQY